MKILQNNIQIEVAKPEKMHGGLVIPDSKEKRLEKGKVIAVSKSIDYVKKGDEILFKQFSVDTVELEGKEYSFIKGEDVLAIL